jgi:hypothetical protein
MTSCRLAACLLLLATSCQFQFFSQQTLDASELLTQPRQPQTGRVRPAEPSRTTPATDPSIFTRWLWSSPLAVFVTTETPPPTRYSSRRLATTPPLFGDYFPGGAILAPAGDGLLVADVPLAGGSRRLKVAEHNKAYPVDRVFFHYHHFHNALTVERLARIEGPVISMDDAAVDRYTIGLEKTLFCGCWSIELRLPFTSRFEVAEAGFGLQGGQVGNLGIILKRLVSENEYMSAVVGLGVDSPTGSDVTGELPRLDVTFEMQNEAVHLAPFVGFLSAPSQPFFYEGFAQLDVPTNGNQIDVSGVGISERGKYTEQTLLYLDLSAGYWLYRNPCSEKLTGLAVLTEIHYTTALQNADAVAFLGGLPSFTEPRNRSDMVNLTVGLHVDIADRAQLRVGGVFPIRGEDGRFFDAEFIASLIRQF